MTKKIVLGSGSPQRLALLTQLLPDADVVSVPPADGRELPFAGELSLSDIEHQLLEIARTKADRVRAQLGDEPFDRLVTGDTVVVVPVAADQFGADQFCVLGKPDPQRFPEDVREWFERFYLGRTHYVLSAVCVDRATPDVRSAVVSTAVRFTEDPALLDWYLGTGESLGKAGGYALQGCGSLFVEQVTGSISNVIGLPLEITRELLALEAA